jgi:TFIIF-interacting CTD phosphatase-like protein
LDLDQTIISGEEIDGETDLSDNKTLDAYKMDDEFVIFARPGLQRFLDFLFANFDVSVWTAASKTYATFIIKNIILNGKPERKLEYVFFLYHCEISSDIGRGMKDLRILKDYFGMNDFSNKKTFIIDDNADVKETNGNNCIAIKPFFYEHYVPGLAEDSYLDKLQTKLKKRFLDERKSRHESIKSAVAAAGDRERRKHRKRRSAEKAI